MKQTKKILLFILIFIFAALTNASAPQKDNPDTAALIINADQGQFKISKYIYGHFSAHLHPKTVKV